MSNKKVTVNYAQLFSEKKAPREYEIEIPSNGETTQDLETVFRYMNHVDGDENGVEAQLIAIGERSLSVGDTVTIDGKTYLCMMIGWKEIPHK